MRAPWLYQAASQGREDRDSYPHSTDEDPEVREDQDSAEKGVGQEAEAAGGSPDSGEQILDLLQISCGTFSKWLNLSVPRFPHLSNGDNKFLPPAAIVRIK